MKKGKGNLIKRMLAALLAVVMTAGMVSNAAPMIVLAAPAPQADFIGGSESIGWTLDGTGKLTISSDEGMADWISIKSETYNETAYSDLVTNVEIRDSVTEIGSNAFLACSSLTEITIPNSVTKICNLAFGSCSSLEKVIMQGDTPPTDVNNITFNGCKFVTDNTQGIHVPADAVEDYKTEWANWANYITDSNIASGTGWMLDEMGKLTISSDEGMTDWLSKKSETYNGTAYANLVTNVEIKDGVTEISYSAFRDCSSLTEITLSDSVTYIGDSVFLDCSGLTEIILPNSVTEIGVSAFNGCSSLEKVIIQGETPPTVYYNTFDRCKFVTDNTQGIHVPADAVEAYKAEWTDWADYITDSNIVFGADWTLDETGKLTISSDEGMTGWNRKKSETYIETVTYKDLVTSVKIKYGVTNISDSAFESCSGLTEVTISDSVTNIGNSAFKRCGSLTEIRIPNRVTKIGNQAFYSCISLTGAALPESVANIGNGAFFNCGSLTEIRIPNRVTKIGYSTFWFCRGLRKITLSDNVTEIGISAFESCESLTDIKIPDSVTLIEMNAFRECNSLKEITIPDSVKSIAGGGVSECSSLEKVIMQGETPPNVHNSSFSECKFVSDNTQGIHVPADAVQSYKDAWPDWADYITARNIASGTSWTLNEAGKLTISSDEGMADWIDKKSETYNETAYKDLVTNVEIKDGVRSIGINAFGECRSLTEITLPNSVTNIGDNAFESCSSLTEVTLPNSVMEIGGNAFNGCSSLTEITIPGSVAKIGVGTFNGCSSLTKIALSDSLTEIGDNAFNGCRSLTEVTIPDSVTEIGYSAFSGSGCLEKVIMQGETPPTVYNDSFVGCKFVTDNTRGIHVPEDAVEAYKAAWPDWAAYIIVRNIVSGTDWTLDNAGKLIISSNKGMTDWISKKSETYNETAYRDLVTIVEIKDGVTKIADSAFYDCGNLTEITLSDSVTYIMGNAFGGCVILTEITLPDSVTYIGDYVFNGCSGLEKVIMQGETPPTVNNNSFAACKFITDNTQGIHVPADAVEAYKEAWPDWANYITDSNIAFGTGWRLDETGKLTISSDEGMTDWISKKSETYNGITYTDLVTNVEIKDGVTNIGDSAFENCSSLTEITLPDSVTEIGAQAFANCSSLTEVTIPDSVTYIRAGAFANCSSLTEVTIPDSVTEIETSAFMNCSSLEKVLMQRGMPPTVNNSTFDGCQFVIDNTRGIHVPADAVEAYKTAWPDWADYITVRNIASGTDWTLDEAGKLTISSNEGMTDWISKKNITYNGTTYTDLVTNVEIKDGVTEIGTQAFQYCSSLTEVTIPDSVMGIETYAFYYCSSLEKVIMQGETPPTVYNDSFDGCKFVSDNTKGIHVPKNTVKAYKEAWPVWESYITDGTHEHNWSSEWTHNETHHWHDCIIQNCPTTDNASKDGYGEHTYDNDSDTDCNTCGYTRTLPDTQPPMGKIEIEDNLWTGFLNSITFGLFFKETKDVTITAEDTASGVDKIYYYISESNMTEAQVKELGEDSWTAGNSFSIAPDRKCIIYAKITDKAGNVTFLSSDGLVFDKTAPVITGVTDGETYNTPQTVTVTDSMSGVKSVTVDGTEVILTDNQFTLGTAENSQTIVATDWAGNTAAIMVTVKAQAHTHDYGEWRQDDTQHWKVCSCGEETGRGNHDFGDWVTDKEATSTEEGTKHRECQTCHYRQTETIPSTGTKPGIVTPEVKPGVNAPATNISTPTEELKDMLLTDEEKQQVQNGTNVKIVLEVQDAGNTVSASDREAVAQALNGFKEGQYLNIDLYKLVGAERMDITETAKKIKIVITVPAGLKNTDSSKTRTFAVIRVHDNKAEFLTDLDDSADTITIETDRFSTYGIVYKDSGAAPTEEPSSQPTVTPPAQPTITPPAQPTITPPAQPTITPPAQPTITPPAQPTVTPPAQPTVTPPAQPTVTPSAQPVNTPKPDESGQTGNLIEARKDLSLLPAAGKQSGKNGIKLNWTKCKNISGYEVYWSYCDGRNNYKKAKTIKASGKRTWLHRKLKTKRTYKYFIAAYKMVDGKKYYITKSPTIHVAMKYDKQTNIRKIEVNKSKITLQEGKTFRINTKLKLENGKKKALSHVAKLRYYTDNGTTAIVSNKGKITAKGKGTCTIYVIANNGVSKKIKVTVK